MKQLIEQQMQDFNNRFKCIQSECDGNGCIPVAKTVGRQVGDNEFVEDMEWTAEQCEFHAVYLDPIKDWHKQSLKQFIDGLIEEANVRVATLEELKAKFNLEIDEHRIDEVERYISYLKKLKEELN